MKNNLLNLAKTLHPARISRLAAYLLKDEAISGKLILIATAIALIAANTPLRDSFESLWHTTISFGVGNWSLGLDLRHWISEGLMTFFFLVVGLELKRELLHGELRTRKVALLPIFGAIGGMVIPAILYLAINFGRESVSGWAIPTATDIALAIGILALLGNRVPVSVRIFLLALAIVDDILAVIVIALFYNSDLNYGFLLIALCLAAVGWGIQRTRYSSMFAFVLTGVGLWLMLYYSGIHPSIGGALIGLLAPITSRRNKNITIAEQVEKAVIPFTTLVVVPLFALANTGIHFDGNVFSAESAGAIAGGILLGLVLGKMLGIAAGSWLAVRFGIAKLPETARWGHIFGVGALAGIGFTVAIFVTELAFDDQNQRVVAKLSIFAASILSALVGVILLRRSGTRTN